MKRWLCGALAALMALTTGCSAILNRDYTSVTPHSATPQADGESNTIRVGSYQELVNALIYLIGRGTEGGAIRFDGGDSDETAIQQMLDEACLEVVQEDPLGAYAVEYIKYSVTPIVGSYEANVQITYRRTREQVAAIVDATGTAAIRSELSEALSEFSSEVVLRISYFEEDSEYIRQLMREAYLSNPASALDFPDAQITMYPETGQRRIVEVLLTYHQSRQTLESRRNSLQREADRLLTALPAGPAGTPDLFLSGGGRLHRLRRAAGGDGRQPGDGPGPGPAVPEDPARPLLHGGGRPVERGFPPVERGPDRRRLPPRGSDPAGRGRLPHRPGDGRGGLYLGQRAGAGVRSGRGDVTIIKIGVPETGTPQAVKKVQGLFRQPEKCRYFPAVQRRKSPRCAR